MQRFTERLAAHSEGSLFLFYQTGEQDLDYFYTLMVPQSKLAAFSVAERKNQPFTFTDYGRIVDHGIGMPTAEMARERLHKKGVVCS